MTDSSSVPTRAALDRKRRIYERITNIAVNLEGCEALLLWDFADNYSWLHPSIIDFPELSKGNYSFPTPFFGGNGETIIPKPAYYGMQSALQSAENARDSTTSKAF